MVQLVKHDLLFILQQIKLAEAHAAGTPLTQIRQDANGNITTDGTGELVLVNPLLPFGLRTVDGSYNNLTDGRSEWGAADNPFPRLSDPNWDNGYTADGSLNVIDPEIRTISNLIVDQTLDNPAAIVAALYHAGLGGTDLSTALTNIETARDALAAADPLDAAAVAAAQQALDARLVQYGVEMEGPTIVIPNVAPDEGLSAPFNALFTIFGQFFDHGLDLIEKKGGMVMIPLQPDDPLYVVGSPTNFMVLTRSLPDAANVTTPYVDQNQTYASHASKQMFMREYALVDDPANPDPDAPQILVATGKLLEGATGGLATWADVKEQARTLLGIELTDADVGNVPLFAVDQYGEFIRGDNGLPQLVVGLGTDGLFGTPDDVLLEGNLLNPVNPTEVGAFRTGHAFLDDIAHFAAPKFNTDGTLAADTDTAVGYHDAAGGPGAFGPRGNTQYDNEMLDRHFITGDGRGNENIALTTIHHVFHSEHNHMVDQIKDLALAEGATDLAFLNEWLLTDVTSLPTTPEELAALNWDGERLFQAARIPTEMQYQHLVFEEFARKIQPDVDIFVFNPSADIDPAIFSEFANVIYRFGHSMLNETVNRTNADGTTNDLTLFDAFLNPVAFDESGIDASTAAGAIARGLSGQVGMEIDEFVADVLRNQLLGIPLDLATLNLARGRETGMPTLNQARAQFQELAEGDSQLDPYTSWNDFAANLKNPMSIVNFIAAYGTHDSITSATTVDAKRDAALLLIFGGDGAPADRLEFLNAQGQYATARGGVDDIDLWVGGLAEKKMAFGGMLGSTFSFVFELQMENLQNGDRFYYLSRMQGLNMLNELENNSLAKMFLNNTDLGESGYALPGDIFSVPDHTIYVDLAMMARYGLVDPVHGNPNLLNPMVQRVDANLDGVAEYIRVNSNDHLLIQGSEFNDTIVSGGGDDSVWGLAGNDRIEAGYGVDKIHGGTGDDIITNNGTDIGETDMLHGEEGNDVIHGGAGLALLFGNQGQDFLITGPDGKEVFGGTGNDFILGGEGGDLLMGNEGDDWMEAGNGFDTTAGDNSELFFNSTIIGHDVMFAGQNEHDFDAESGDDIMGQGASVMRNEGMFGFDWAIHKFNTEAADSDMKIKIFTTEQADILRDRFDQTEALSGWRFNDVLRGDDRTSVALGGVAETGMENNGLSQAGVNRITGLRELFGDWIAAAPTSGDLETVIAFEEGNVILGGSGSDLMEGRGGNDLIDGDAWLNVRIAIDHGGVAYSADRMTTRVYLASDVIDGVVQPGAVAQFGGLTLNALALNGTINPGSMSIVREIVQDDGVGDNDIAQFWDVRENYTFVRNADGSLDVTHTGFDAANAPANTFSDATDRLRNIETLRFGDGVGGFVDISAAQIENAAPTGRPTINDATPTETFTLSAATGDIADPNTIASAFSYQWQTLVNGVWVNIAGATDVNFAPGQAQVGAALRVSVNFTDGAGLVETVVSEPTGIVGDRFIGTQNVAANVSGTAGSDHFTGANRNDTFVGGAGDDGLFGGFGNDRLTGGTGDDWLSGWAGNDDIANFSGPASNYSFAIDGAGRLIVTDTVGTDGQDTLVQVERLFFGGASNRVQAGTQGNDNISMGSAVSNDILLGFGGNDTLNGGFATDYLDGGAGNDSLLGGANNDTLAWRAGGGRDFMDGGTGVDHAHIAGDGTAEVFDIYTVAAAVLAGLTVANAATEIVITRNGAIIAELDNIEEIVLDGQGGGDTFNVHGDFTGTSLFYSTITIEGTTADDTIDISALESAHRVVFRSHGGEDTVVGALRPQDVMDGVGGVAAGSGFAFGEMFDLAGLGQTALTQLHNTLLQEVGGATMAWVGGQPVHVASNGLQGLSQASLVQGDVSGLALASQSDLNIADIGMLGLGLGIGRPGGPGGLAPRDVSSENNWQFELRDGFDVTNTEDWQFF